MNRNESLDGKMYNFILQFFINICWFLSSGDSSGLGMDKIYRSRPILSSFDVLGSNISKLHFKCMTYFVGFLISNFILPNVNLVITKSYFLALLIHYNVLFIYLIRDGKQQTLTTKYYLIRTFFIKWKAKVSLTSDACWPTWSLSPCCSKPAFS